MVGEEFYRHPFEVQNIEYLIIEIEGK